MNDEIRKRMQALSDEEILNMIDKNPGDYTEEALNVAKEEVNRRGGTEQLYKKIEEEYKQAQAKKIQQIAEKGREEAQKELKDIQESIAELHSVSGNTRSLKDETVAESAQRMIFGALGNGPRVIQNIQTLLAEMKVPLKCRWGVVEVKTKGWISRVTRDFLTVEVEEFPDYHIYISARDFGLFLDCIYILTVEPGIVKRFLSRKLTESDRGTGGGDEEALSRPKNILKMQDFNAWKLIVKSCFDKVVHDLEKEVCQIPGQVLGRDKQFLDMW
ncbi:MAG TPA: hypothetical protein VHP63_05295 [candidate division Zixibacteria bacterium]|nr:hypothetical protein [candidate division Zixibacteria bacterium]